MKVSLWEYVWRIVLIRLIDVKSTVNCGWDHYSGLYKVDRESWAQASTCQFLLSSNCSCQGTSLHKLPLPCLSSPHPRFSSVMDCSLELWAEIGLTLENLPQTCQGFSLAQPLPRRRLGSLHWVHPADSSASYWPIFSLTPPYLDLDPLAKFSDTS